MLQTFDTYSRGGHQDFGPFSLAPVPIALVDRQGVLLALNQKGVSLLNRREGLHLDSFTFCEFFDVRNPDRFVERLKTYFDLEENAVEPVLLHCRDNGSHSKSRCLEVSLAPFCQSNTVLVYFADVSPRLELEKELRSSRRAAQAANRAKTYFLANMSHEIRTPLGAILGYVDLVSSGDGTAEERWAWSHRIKDNAQNLKLLIDDILEISRIDAEQPEEKKEDIDLGDLLSHVQQSFAATAQGKGLELNFTADSQVPKHLITDGSRVRQILFKLVGNAIKFTEKGAVKVSLNLSRTSEVGERLVFDVEDTGPGIFRSEVQHLFRPFMQADMKYTRRHGGSGLGLALSRRLARALGGELHLLKTQRNKGSIFRFELPLSELAADYERVSLNPRSPVTIQPSALPDLSGRRVLLVEDSEDNQILVQRMLSKAGAEVHLAINGQEGVEKAMGGDFTLVLMDIQMPVMDGYAAKKKLAELKYDRPVVAFTAHSLASEVDKTKAAGFHAHLTKPINKEKLYRLVSELDL